ncbi:hypothetical protein AYL99_08515 [Fonsecaea erecta]|uniref:Myb-like domain-containing protein n=1 Tax=Fonsecaea erecta TaxID=1367422 RepID=A0A178ZDC0_9EURO|nr:hypothetical protein AYL99_08515 [Fonsecaea erecta]OAP57777.1 hypothetical protein AYL99_08515 [Fonsecaea erecta]
MPFKWDAASERNLLLFAIAEMTSPATSIWAKVAERLGNDLNANACSQKFYKLKKDSGRILHQGDATVSGDSATLVKEAKTPKTPTSKATPVRKRKAADADDGEDVKPSIKRKKNAKKDVPSVPEVKEEVQDEEDNIVKTEERNDD